MGNSLARNLKPMADFPSRCLFFFAFFLFFSWSFPGMFDGDLRAGGPYDKIRKMISGEKQKEKSDAGANQKTNGKSGKPIAGSEYEVKAGLIYRFGLFSRWPKGSFKDEKSPLAICVMSNNAEVEKIFETEIRGKTIGGRKVVVKGVFGKKAIDDCHILYINSDNKEFIRENLKLANGKSVLTIGETEDFTQMCGIITISIKHGKVRFYINEQAGKRAGLKFKSGMKVAADKLFEEGCGK